ncbi:SusC/RagA family TonB-linked outer membrane protein [Saccharicrinis sp. FJH54]|uniref:SusC/RagA family TonB-linked outer membrane protein n=1 Tax=Saccharicrinis sp. FJH54 TaxID=3344665 RepID=UPI0035D50D0D
MRKILIVIYLSCMSAFLFAQQQIQVTGKVTDANNDAIPGVSVVITGTTQGTITDLDGNYSIMASDQATLTFRFIGFKTVDIPVNGRKVINVTLEEDVYNVDEVVVVGYGEMKVKDLTSSIVTVKSDELLKTPSSQPMQALQGKIAGVQIVNSGSPGGNPTVRIRGIGSFPGSSDASPLYVVDGMYFDNIDFLNPSDIESVSVLKDASASAIYGVRAANGVVLVTTKKGNLNSKSTITYEGYYGVQVPQNVLKMANSEQFVNYIDQTGSTADMQYILNAMQRYERSRINPNFPNVNTDWYAEIMKPYAPQQNHSLTVMGGSDKTSYSIGMSYFDQEGLLETDNSYSRMNIRSKIDQQVNNWFKAGINFNFSNAVRYIGNDAAWFSAYHAVPILPVYDDANYNALIAEGVTTASRYSSAELVGYRGSQNPFISLAFNNNRQDIRKFLTGVYAEIDLIPDQLKFKSTYNISMMFLKAKNVGFPYFITNDTEVKLSNIASSRTTDINQFWDNTLTYTNSFGKHNLTAMVGMSFRDESYDYLYGYAEDIPLAENSWYINLSNSETSKDASESASRLYGVSYFGRLSYNFDNRYIAYFTLREEGTQKYQEHWGTFPAFGLGWVLSEESFFKDINFFDYLKLRGGWGKLGNDKIPRQTGAYTTNPQYLAIDDKQVDATTTTSTFGYLGWETVTGTNIGITANMLNSRLHIDADYYIRDTENAAIPVSLKLQSGSVLKNAGVIRNSGLEIVLNWDGKISKDLKYNIGVNVATLKNEVLDLYGQEYINGGMAEFRQRTQVGEPLLSFYGYEVAGVYQNDGQIQASQIAVDNELVPGDLMFKDQNSDGIIDDNDKVFLGSYFPNLTYGGNLGLTYKNIDFSVNVMGQSGNKILNRKRGEIIWTNDTNIDEELASGLWNGEGTSDRYPSASGLRRGWNQNFSDFFLEDGAFFRIQNVQLAYNLKGSTLFKGMPNAKIYVSAEKPLTLFKYNGFTPEVPDGIDRQFYPVPAIYTVGLNLKF